MQEYRAMSKLEEKKYFGDINISKETMVSGHFNVEKLHVRDGASKYQRDVCLTKDAVFVLPFDPVNKKVVLLREKRFGLFNRGDDLRTWSSISGTIDKVGTPEDIAMQELEEEAGLIDGKLKKICAHYSSPGIITEKKYIYSFEFDSTTFKEGEYGASDENELIDAKLFNYDDIEKMIEDFELTDLNAMYAFEKIKNIIK